jgi:ubiquinone/menaquinone biosynthesis C-methylase UbiE
MSVENLSFKEESFDCILCFHVLEHIHNTTKVASEFKRVLKKNGYVIAESPHWITTMSPSSFNFYDDPTHVRPHNKQSFSRLFSDFNIQYVKFESSIYMYAAQKERRFSPKYILRQMLKCLGVYRNVVFIIAKK